MTDLELTKLLITRSHDLERQRTRALATAKWLKVIEVEARIDEIKLIRKEVGKEKDEPVTTTPTS